MKPIKFYRVQTLPEVGEVGSIYFVYSSHDSGRLYVCTDPSTFENYSGSSDILLQDPPEEQYQMTDDGVLLVPSFAGDVRTRTLKLHSPLNVDSKHNIIIFK